MTQKRNLRAGVEDRWYKTVRDEHGNPQTVPSATYGKGKRWRARYVDEQGREHVQSFTRKVDAQQWLTSQTATIVAGTQCRAARRQTHCAAVVRHVDRGIQGAPRRDRA